ncbi:PREDICTED: ABC transporter C family member 7-like [Tarenaya hassleriana]|uniref:ABC transporter C family member 7-like n=1 Tax=Tarenaya hassleriana TaxID=28532 RepID=UPI00053C4D7E|nr:PREDICTED: ABC transporter C family member 7-like [Tarenaya hassleriana]
MDNGIWTVWFSLYQSQMHQVTGFSLLELVYLPLFSIFLHLLLLLVLFGSWVSKKMGKCSEDARFNKTISSTYNKTVFMFCVTLSVFNLVLLSLLSYYYWHSNGWLHSKLANLLDFLLEAIAWAAISIYLKSLSPDSSKEKFPFLLRLWWVFYFIVSCCSLVADIVLYRRHEVVVPVYLSLVSDVAGVTAGLFLCYVCFLRKIESESSNFLEDPLLNCAETSDERNSIKVTPFAKARILSHVSFSWMSSLIDLGNKKIIDAEDVPQLDRSDRAEELFQDCRSKLEEDVGRMTMFKLIKLLFFSAQRDIVLSTLFAFVYTLSCYVAPYLMDTFVQYLNGRRRYQNEGCVLVTTFFVAKVVECQSRRNWYFRLQKAGIRMRSVLVSMIYDKGLTLPCHSKEGHTSGEIINLMTVDAERISAFSWYMHDPWILMLQVSLALLILYRSLGLGSIAAFSATFMVMLANFPFAKLEEKFQSNLMESKDKRMRKTSEILLNMRILKLQSWEMKFLNKILELRQIEAGWLKRFVYNSAVISSVLWAAPSFVSAAAFGACMLINIPLESGKILSALATFRILQDPIYKLPDTISMIVQTKVSLNRIASFLCLDDLQRDVVEKLPESGRSCNVAVEVNNASFSWDGLSSNPTLSDMSFRVIKGMKVAICGTVGSGKSSLLASILGEVPKLSGSVKVYGTKAYVSQSPWIQSGKVEENILFGKPMDRELYESVLEACSLKSDLEILPFRDQTVIGERGINLSGGQKQRIQIARALYQNADIYLFDDPFSAVDAHTGSHLFKGVLMGLLSCKTVIYVTHQVEFLPAADLILVMKDGSITQAGKYDEILYSGTDFMELVGAHSQALAAVDDTVSSSAKSTASKENELSHDEENREEESGQIVQEEEREKGRVGFDVYRKYLTLGYGGGALIPFILLVQILFQLLNIGSNYWMACVTPVSKGEESPVKGSTLISVYVALAIASSLCILVRATLVAMIGFQTATELFNQMHLCIFRAPMSFFDSTPTGRILNRASTDQSVADLRLPNQFATVAVAAINILGIIGVMGQVAWPILVVFIPVVAICVWYRKYYISAARELARLAGISRSPLIQHFSETLSGITTIRSFDQEARFRSDGMRLSDYYSRLKFHSAGAMEWLCFRLDLLSSVAFALSLVLLISAPEGVINPSIAGLAVTYALNLNTLQATLIWTLCDLENKMISVERMLQYIDIPSEPPLVIESNRPDQSWPSLGDIKIHNLQVRYAPHLPLVLRGITCSFHGGLKTGIVGRTGCGKSTLIQTLFRIVEPAAGEIKIDGVNISMIGLHDLRSRLSIIPQDPTMFEGTIRSNLDPLEEYTDQQIWEALDKCQLGDEVRKKERKLDSAVSENGQNWSVGQRQLVCLGRVLLKKSKVLVLDEATASVDTMTDHLIQQTLRHHFSDCTVVTIAHRISSVIDSDMVLLLNQGVIEEHDSPTRLLQDKCSSFSKLVSEYTERSGSSLRKI